MAHLEYPKHVYKDGQIDQESAVVKNLEEERAAGLKGYVALPSAPQPEGADAVKAEPDYLEFPKHVYKGEGEARESIVVKNADEEAAAKAQGYLALDAVADEPGDDAPKGGKKRSAKA